jgi:hypothetical protein
MLARGNLSNQFSIEPTSIQYPLYLYYIIGSSLAEINKKTNVQCCFFAADIQALHGFAQLTLQEPKDHVAQIPCPEDCLVMYPAMPGMYFVV